MAENWTPGPWEENPILKTVYLIAAAPEMYDALAMVRDADDDCRKDGMPTLPEPARAAIDAALRKARGED